MWKRDYVTLYSKTDKNVNDRCFKEIMIYDKRQKRDKAMERTREKNTSVGHLIRPICLSTRRSRSLSSCSLPVWPSLPEGWGGTNTPSYKLVAPQHHPLPHITITLYQESMFSLSFVHTVAGSLNDFMVRLLLKARLWQLSNSCFNLNVARCQTQPRPEQQMVRLPDRKKEEWGTEKSLDLLSNPRGVNFTCLLKRKTLHETHGMQLCIR